MKRYPSACGQWSVLVLAAMAIVVVSFAAEARGEDSVLVRGELARLARQAYDYQYRNSNGNVFRKSNHNHPTRNVFRSSNHYKRRLAASFDGYPIRTFESYTVRDGDRSRVRSRSYAYHRRHPQGAGINDFGWGNGVGPYELGYERMPTGAVEGDEWEMEPVEIEEEPRVAKRPRTRSEIEMTVIRMEPREPKQRAVLRTVTLADGTVKTIIASEPIAKSVDDAWAVLTRGDHEGAAELFAGHALDADRGAEAMLGHGLARALSGDYEAAAVSVRRAVALDPGVLDAFSDDPTLHDALEDLRDRLAMDEAVSAEDDGEAAYVLAVVRELLG